MEIIYEAFNFFKKNGFVDLNHVIVINNEIDHYDLCSLYEKMKYEKDIIKFMDIFQIHYFNAYSGKHTNCDDTNNIHILGKIGIGECIICLDEEMVGYKTFCNHFMCIKCYSSLFEAHKFKNCPYCRKKIIFDSRMNEIIENKIKEQIEDIQHNGDDYLGYE